MPLTSETSLSTSKDLLFFNVCVCVCACMPKCLKESVRLLGAGVPWSLQEANLGPLKEQ